MNSLHIANQSLGLPSAPIRTVTASSVTSTPLTSMNMNTNTNMHMNGPLPISFPRTATAMAQNQLNSKPSPNAYALSSSQMLNVLNAANCEESDKASAALALSFLAGSKRTHSPTCVVEAPTSANPTATPSHNTASATITPYDSAKRVKVDHDATPNHGPAFMHGPHQFAHMQQRIQHLPTSMPMAAAQFVGSPSPVVNDKTAAALQRLQEAVDGSYKRKDKSLGVLCVNFMVRYNQLKLENPNELPAVSIDEAAQSLAVERRRIYDIINILEAIKVVSRKCKNTYNWHGMDNITETFRELQAEAVALFPEDAIKNGLIPADASTDEKMAATAATGTEAAATEPEPAPKAQIIPSGLAMLLASAEQVEETTTPKGKKKASSKEKSLGRLSQKFIQLFLVGNETIALNDASDKILGKTDMPEPPAGSTAADIIKARNSANKMLKTKIRRLYDIANVMASIGLITKLNGGNNLSNAARNRPSFKWVYPQTAKQVWDNAKAEEGASISI